MEVDNSRILATLSVGEFKEVMMGLGAQKPKEEEKPHTYVYGLDGICKLFGVCRTTAQTYKDTFLKDAIQQHGRKIVVDVELARDLFKLRRII